MGARVSPTGEPPHGRIAVIGAGIAGLMCARTLADHGAEVSVLEKSRGLGGRCATRREGVWRFDHGAQYFTVRDPALAAHRDRWHTLGLIAPWEGALASRDASGWHPVAPGVDRWVAVPGMSALASHLAEGLDVRLTTAVSRVTREGAKWRILTEGRTDVGMFDSVLFAMPSPQAAALLAPIAPAMAQRASDATMLPTWAAMLVLPERPEVEWDGAFLRDDPVLAWCARGASKPGRPTQESWVLHATHEWSRANLEREAVEVAQAMHASFQQLVGHHATPLHLAAHRWRYAVPAAGALAAPLHDAELRLGAAGDWCGAPRVEGALLSGVALASLVLARDPFTPDRVSAS